MAGAFFGGLIVGVLTGLIVGWLLTCGVALLGDLMADVRQAAQCFRQAKQADLHAWQVRWHVLHGEQEKREKR